MKTYQQPSTSIVTVALSQIIAASPVENGFDMEEVETTTTTSGNLTRRQTVWDEEEEE